MRLEDARFLQALKAAFVECPRYPPASKLLVNDDVAKLPASTVVAIKSAANEFARLLGDETSRRFGHTVRALRHQRHGTQAQLANEARLSMTYIGEIERGQRTPSLLTVVRIAAALDLKASDMLRQAKI